MNGTNEEMELKQRFVEIITSILIGFYIFTFTNFLRILGNQENSFMAERNDRK